MNIVFFGSSKYSVIDEEALYKKFGLSLVVTLPDRKNFKTNQVLPNPVKQFALANNLPVVTTEKITQEIVQKIAAYHPDFLVVADYGVILPKDLLALPKKAAINVHQSLLPKYRGPAPVPFAILAGEKTVGVTIMLISETVDTGDMLAQTTYALKPHDTTDSVLRKLNELGGQLVVKAIENFEDAFAKRQAQDESNATVSTYMSKKDSFVDLNNPPVPDVLRRMIHAYYPWPTVWTRLRLGYGGQAKEKIVKLLPENTIQVEGKKPMTYKDFINGYSEGKEVLHKLGLL